AALRTTFHAQDGRPVQRIHDESAAFFQTEDATSWTEQQLDDRLGAEAHRPFDLENGPLIRVHVFQCATDELVLLLSAHHIVVDFWSLALLVDELAVLYEAKRSGAAATLPPLRFDYADYQARQQELLDGPDGERLLNFWRERLRGELPMLDLATDKPRPAQQTYSG